MDAKEALGILAEIGTITVDPPSAETEVRAAVERWERDQRGKMKGRGEA